MERRAAVGAEPQAATPRHRRTSGSSATSRRRTSAAAWPPPTSPRARTTGTCRCTSSGPSGCPSPRAPTGPASAASAARLRRPDRGRPDRSRRIQLDGEATALWCDELYDEFTAADDEEQAWAEFMRRAAPYCLRIAGLYAVLDGAQAHRQGRPRRGWRPGALLDGVGPVSCSAAAPRSAAWTGSPARSPRRARAGLTRTQISALFGRNLRAGPARRAARRAAERRRLRGDRGAVRRPPGAGIPPPRCRYEIDERNEIWRDRRRT